MDELKADDLALLAEIQSCSPPEMRKFLLPGEQGDEARADADRYGLIGSSIITAISMWAFKRLIGKLALSQRTRVIELALLWFDRASAAVDLPIPDGTELLAKKMAREILETTLNQLFNSLELLT